MKPSLNTQKKTYYLCVFLKKSKKLIDKPKTNCKYREIKKSKTSSVLFQI